MSAYEWALVAGLFLSSAILSYAVLRAAIARGRRASLRAGERTTPPEIPDEAEHAAALSEARELRARSEGLLSRVSAGSARSLNDASAKAAEAIADIYDAES